MAARMSVMCVLLLAASMFRIVSGHGAVTKPVPRRASANPWCPWCVGEHQPVSNPPGQSHHTANPSTPCMGTRRGDAPYEPMHFSGYSGIAASSGPYVAGQKFDATIVLDADHNGDAQWGYCPHSEPETEECFRNHPVTEFINVAAYWGEHNPGEHVHSKEHYPQEVMLPANMPGGPATLRWLWICKNTDEIFLSCIDVNVDGSTVPDTPVPTPVPTPAPTAEATNPVVDVTDCMWASEEGATVIRTEQLHSRKAGRLCWDVQVQGAATVYYQAKSDVYHTWNTDTCCLRASETHGSAQAGASNIVQFTVTGGSFGFCECTAWDANDPGTSCAGGAAAENMVCPVMGAADGMCSQEARNSFMMKGGVLDGEPVSCGGGGSTPSTTATTTDVGTTPEPEPESEAETESETTPEPTVKPTPQPTRSPTASPTMQPTALPTDASGCQPVCQPASGANTPECNGKDEQTCKNMMQYESKCNWACLADTPSGGSNGCTQVCEAKPGANTPECNGKPETECRRMITQESKCQLREVCDGSLLSTRRSSDVGAHVHQPKRQKFTRFLSPLRALVQTMQSIGKSEPAVEQDFDEL